MRVTHFSKYFTAFFLVLFAHSALAQQPAPPGPEKKQLVELLPGAGVLIGDTLRGENIRKVKKDTAAGALQVKFKQGLTLMYCDSAIQYPLRNVIDAFGHITLVDADSTVVTGDSLFYDGNTRLARLRGNVVLVDREKTVTTHNLNYNLGSKIANYFGGGTVRNDSSTLVSEVGYYNTLTKVATFRKKVRYVSPGTELEADTLTYLTRESLVKFNSRTRISTRNGFVIADGGEYNETLGKSKFKGRAKIETADYIIGGDILDYDKITEKGIAKKNVEFYGKKDNITVLGDLGKHDGLLERTEVYGNAVLISPPKTGTDTLFISADTLISYLEKSGVDTIPDRKFLIGYRNVKAYQNDFRSNSDSIGYFLNDSTINFYYDPIIWSKGSQLVAQHIAVKMKKGKIDLMNLNEKAFITSLDTVKNFNQTRGRNIQAKFRQGELRQVDVKGNGESLYHALEQDTLVTGVNYIKCSEMKISFNDSSQLTDIMFYQQPDGKFIPPHEWNTENTRLETFNWRVEEQPTKGEVLGIHAGNRYKTGELVGAKLVVDDFFQVFQRGKTLIFYKQATKAEDIKPRFVVQVYPKDKNDIPIERRKAGFEDLGFDFPADALQNGTAKHSLVLPDYKIARIVIGQRIASKPPNWQKIYVVK
jgi:lipopolysaccharide export system protein LptA